MLIDPNPLPRVRGAAVAPPFASIAAAEQARNAPAGAAYVYARFGTGASHLAERHAAEVLDAPWAVVATSGTMALDVALGGLALARGERLVVAVADGLYVGTRRYFERIVAGLRGVPVVAVPFVEAGADPAAFAAEVARIRPAVVVAEAVTNPFLAVADVAAMAAATHAADGLLLVDATAAPPPNASPLLAGADLVLHSATKYLGGQGDVLAGVLTGSAPEHRDACRDYRRLIGGVLDPVSCDRLRHDLGDVTVRFARQVDNAGRAAALLRDSGAVREVWSAASGEVTAALVTFELAVEPGAGVRAACEAFVAAAHPTIPFTASFGSVDSTVTLVGLLDRDLADRPVLRLSCGTETWPVLRDSLTRALEASRPAPAAGGVR